MTATAGAGVEEEIRRRLREDYEFAIDTARCAKIVNKAGETVTMRLKRPQRRLVREIVAQREAGQPQRVIDLKSRQVGMSTLQQVLGILRTTQTENHVAITVAQDRDTVSSLFDKGRFAWAHLPEEIKPPTAYEGGTKERRYLQFGEAAIKLRRAGVVGLNSMYETATANRTSAGRGRTIHTLHLSEPAHWDDYGMMLGIVQGVPDLPNTLIHKESTANGNNEFKDEWDDAVAGSSGYVAIFSPWYEEEEYSRRFANELDFEEFESKLGTGRSRREQEAAEEELVLFDQIRGDLTVWATEEGAAFTEETIRRRTLEHLHWRRWAIGAKTLGDLEKFHQEYPSNPEEAFLSTGRRVFKADVMRHVMREAERQDPVNPSLEETGPSLGLLRGVGYRPVRSRRRATIDVPQEAEWVPRRKRSEDEVARWRLWNLPRPESFEPYVEGAELELGQQVLGEQLWTPPGQYLVSVDTASGVEDDTGTVHANHAISIIDHRSLKLVGEFESQQDPDDLAEEALLAAFLFNRAWIVVEATGGWGLPVLRRLSLDYHYPRLFTRQTVRARTDDISDTLGFSTDVVTKPLLEARAIEIARDFPELITSRVLAGQMLTYVRDEKGRTLPEPGKLSDVLMSWMVGQYVATLRPIRQDRPGGAKRANEKKKPRGASR